MTDLSDVVIDHCSPAGDAFVCVGGLDVPVGPGSSVGYVTVVNMLKCLVAEGLTQRGQPPLVLTSSVLIGAQASAELFDKSYDDFRRRVGQLYR